MKSLTQQMHQCRRLAGPYVARLLMFVWLFFQSALTYATDATAFSFGVISHTAKASPDDSLLRESIAASDADNLAFVLVNGIKAGKESCSDALFARRRTLFEQAKNGLILSVAASDWSACRTADGRSAAIERLNRIRELFFGNDFSFGATKLPLTRQGRTPKFRTYTENLWWDIDRIVFATVNLPANNNDYLSAAGRNSEFEDRTIAIRFWLHRLLSSATRRGAIGIVLFVDGNPLSLTQYNAANASGSYRDGFLEIRHLIRQLAQQFNGRIMLIHGQDVSNVALANTISWQGNIASLHISSGWQKITVDPATSTLFHVDPALLSVKPVSPE